MTPTADLMSLAIQVHLVSESVIGFSLEVSTDFCLGISRIGPVVLSLVYLMYFPL